MMGRNIRFKGALWEIIPTSSVLPLFISSTEILGVIVEGTVENYNNKHSIESLK